MLVRYWSWTTGAEPASGNGVTGVQLGPLRFRHWTSGDEVVVPETPPAATPTPAGRRGRKPRHYFVEWRGKLYKVEGERDGLILLKRLREEELDKLRRTAPVIAKRSVKQSTPPPVEPPRIVVTGDAPVRVRQAAVQTFKAIQVDYHREATQSYIKALEWRVAILEDDNDSLIALLLDD